MNPNRFEFRLDPTTSTQLKRLASQTGRSQGDVIRSLIRTADRLLEIHNKLDFELIDALARQKARAHGE